MRHIVTLQIVTLRTPDLQRESWPVWDAYRAVAEVAGNSDIPDVFDFALSANYVTSDGQVRGIFRRGQEPLTLTRRCSCRLS